MPLDILGRTRATMELLESILLEEPFIVLCAVEVNFSSVARLK